MNPTLAKYFLGLYLEKRNAAGRTYEGAEHMRGPNTSIAFKSLMIFSNQMAKEKYVRDQRHY